MKLGIVQGAPFEVVSGCLYDGGTKITDKQMRGFDGPDSDLFSCGFANHRPPTTNHRPPAAGHDGEIALLRTDAQGNVVYTALCRGSSLESGEHLLNIEGIADFHETGAAY